LITAGRPTDEERVDRSQDESTGHEFEVERGTWNVRECRALESLNAGESGEIHHDRDTPHSE
jgi:hypothetical protein